MDEKTVKISQKKTFFRLITLIVILAFLALGISSCNLPDLGGIFSSNKPTGVPDATQATPTPSASATPNSTPVVSQSLIIWVPPLFDPSSGTTAGNLFQTRLMEFTSRQPQTDVQLRVKALEGDYGLLESLLLTESAAPIIKPDLIALPRHLMEQAYQEGLIIPISDMITADLDEWFDYALEMAQVDGEITGVPFAGDLLTLAYKNDTSEDPPPNWESILNFQKALAFPASDTSALVTLAHYQSLGGEFLDGSGSYTFDDQLMLDVLEYYQLAQASGVMPYWITQFETEEQAWQSYLDRQSTLALSWSSTILSSETANTSLSGMPTQDGKAFSYATGWVWCVIPSSQENEIMAVELAEFLTEETYLSIWGLQAGFMPVQPSALSSWSELPYYATLQQLLPAAVMIPSNNLQAEYGPAVKEAVVAVLKDQIDPVDALGVLLEDIPAP